MGGAPSKPPAILALDLGARLGWASMSRSGRVESGVHIFKGGLDERMGLFLVWLSKNAPRDALCIEQPYNLKGHAASSLLGMAGIARGIGRTAGVEIYSYPPTKIKKTVTMNGRSGKKEVMEWAKKAYKLKKVDDNQADALAVLQTYLEK